MDNLFQLLLVQTRAMDLAGLAIHCNVRVLQQTLRAQNFLSRPLCSLVQKLYQAVLSRGKT